MSDKGQGTANLSALHRDLVQSPSVSAPVRGPRSPAPREAAAQGGPTAVPSAKGLVQSGVGNLVPPALLFFFFFFLEK